MTVHVASYNPGVIKSTCT